MAAALVVVSATAIELLGESVTVDGITSNAQPFVWPGMANPLVAWWLAEWPEIGTAGKLAPNTTARFTGELWIPGFPVPHAGGPTGRDIVVPSLEDRNRTGRTSIIIAEHWAMKVAEALDAMPCNWWTLTRLRPLNDGADLAGWTLEATVQL